jgi:NAD(P)-dependent dehydrogenase (short-subunit alcohol dehydrogenase family)
VTTLDGKVALVTGANTGIGFETAVALAARGARVVIGSRNPARGATAIDALEARTGARADVLALDLASFAATRDAAKTFADGYDRLDILVNNAGIILWKRQVTADGHEMQFQTNHLGPFLLTALLREQLVASAPARVVTVSSDAHRTAVRGIDFDDLESARRYRPFGVYSRTKLMNVLFTRELARRLDGTGVTANAVHPGYVASRFARDGDTGKLGNVAMALGRPFAQSPEVGARTSVYVASAPDVEGVTGQYFARSRLAQPSRHARDDAAAGRLWDVSASRTGATP